jgi:hypothetical protein
MTILYNIEKQKIIGYYDPWYPVNGKPGLVEPPAIELEVVQTPRPEITNIQILQSEWVVDTINKTYTLIHNVRNKTQYEIDIENWNHVEYSLRIKAPIQLIMDDIGIKMYGWFQINNLPVENKNDGYIYLYCNIILPDHQNVIDLFQGVIIIENKPEL